MKPRKTAGLKRGDGLARHLLPWHSPSTFDDAESAVDRILRAEPKLRAWTEYAVQGFALYTGANEALKDRIDPSSNVSQLADWYRQDVALMTVMRVDSLFDRGAEISFQTVYQDLLIPRVRETMARHYVESDPELWSGRSADCTDAIDRYLERYRTIPWAVHGNLQHFRNDGLAHITDRDVRRRISYADLARFVELAAHLAAELTLIARGLNVDHIERLSDISLECQSYWEDSIRLMKEAEGRVSELPLGG